MTCRTAKSFTRRNWTVDELAVARALKGQKLAKAKELRQSVINELKRETGPNAK